jgi:hypothetical protein
MTTASEATGVDHIVLTGDRARFVRCQEQHDAGDILTNQISL